MPKKRECHKNQISRAPPLVPEGVVTCKGHATLGHPTDPSCLNNTQRHWASAQNIRYNNTNIDDSSTRLYVYFKHGL